MSKSVLVLTPHPDDAEFFAGGTIAKMVAEGAQVVIVVTSDGNKGSFDYDSQSLAQIRREEALRAAAVLGAEPPVFLGHPDMELDRLPPGFLREQFIRAIRRHKPDVVIAEDPFAPYEVHPDHRAVAWAASDALNAAHLPLVHPEHLTEGLQPHFVVEKYFYVEHVPAANRVVDISETMGRKLAALSEHRSQVVFLVEEVVRQARLAGVDLERIVGGALSDPMAAMAWAVQAQAAEIGQRIGVRFGEAFRYVRFHPMIEAILAGERRE